MSLPLPFPDKPQLRQTRFRDVGDLIQRWFWEPDRQAWRLESERTRAEYEARQAPVSQEHAKRNYSIAVDFDGVIHSYTSPWVSPDVIPDPPVPGAIDWLNEISGRFTVIIFTTRGKTLQGRVAVRKWLIDHGLQLSVSNQTKITDVKPPALIYLDDRAVRFDGTNFPTAGQIHRDLVPWNKQRRGGESQ